MRIAVIGGGITGLVAARSLAIAASSTTSAKFLDVDLYESTGRIGGKLSSTDFAGVSVDTGPDSFLARRPEAVALCRELGLEERLAAPGAAGAFIAIGNDLKRIPSNLALGVPTRLSPLVRSVLEHRILTLRGMSRFAVGFLFPSLPVPDTRPAGHLYPAFPHVVGNNDHDLGRLIERHMGREVARHLADPLIGGINARSIYGMSAAAVFPPILEASRERGSLAVNLARRMAATGPAGGSGGNRGHGASSNNQSSNGNASGSALSPVFYSLEGGMSSLVHALEGDVLHRGVKVWKDTPVVALDRVRDKWFLATRNGHDGHGEHKGYDGYDGYDGIVLAVPATVAGKLLQPLSPVAARMLSAVPYASVSVVTLHAAHMTEHDLPDGTGYIVPADGMHMVTACTFLSKKWRHLATENGSLLRASLGRHGDSRHLSFDNRALVEAVTSELEQVLHRRVEPDNSLVTRWVNAFPQYRVGHLSMVEEVRRLLPGTGPVSLAGAAYGGVGIPACIKSGCDAASSILEQLENAA
ncbi:MAG: protoporphyrinogen oxidase [Acidimicrobiales bacterium]